MWEMRLPLAGELAQHKEKTENHNMFKSAKALFYRSREIDKEIGLHAERLSWFLWPRREHWLFLVVGALAILDFTSTYILLDLNKKAGVYESGLLAIWALDRGGFVFLFMVDIAAAVVPSLAAFTARYLYTRRGFPGYGRAAFVFLLVPYMIIAVAAIGNNIILLCL
jgi:hypothetical protein